MAVTANNSVPLIFLGSISAVFFITSLWNLYRRHHRRAVLPTTQADFEHGMVVVVRNPTRKADLKKLKPKMWDIFVPRWHKSPSSTEVNEIEEVDIDADEKKIGKWEDIKPMTVSYLKSKQNVVVPPLPKPELDQQESEAKSSPVSPKFGPLFLPIPPSRTPSKKIYDKSAISAVQVSVLISMPGVGRNPLQLGVANISLEDAGKWRRRPSIMPPGYANPT